MQPPRRNLAGRFILVVAGCLALAGLAPAGKGGPNDLASYDALIKPSDRKHWAFQPVRRPALPIVKNAAWMRNPIDAFILAKLEARNWRPAPAAQPRALLRRLFFDLSGLPPTLAEQEAFLKDPSPQALDQIATELLARPTYGERWARHWLDLVRYAETNGYERDATKPNVWRYRDYVITALNGDKPFDRFILEQLAGDELPDVSSESLIASGYCRLGPWDDEPADPKEDRFDQLDDMVSTTSLAFLGLSLGCARCHNHKFDALTQHDYYRMVAIFDPLQRPKSGRSELDKPAASRDQIIARAGREAAVALAGFETPLSTLGPAPLSISSVVSLRLVAEARDPYAALPRGYFLVEPSVKPPATHLLIRGKASRPGPEVAPGMPAVLVSSQPSFPAAGERSTLRRLTLANWIASPANPLTARVIVNRVWQFHFGEGLVRTPSDFGVMGEPPTHPELLDWLADWFVKEGWSLKKLHRLIVTSNAYRMSKAWNPEYGAQDPENLLLWRMHYRRLEVEAMRDSILAVSGQLNRTMFGPSMYPEIPREALAGHSDPDQIWKPFNEREASRRTIYAFIKRSMVVPMLEVLDLCDTARSSAKRSVTTVAPQALSLFNGAFVNRQARYLAQRLLREVGQDPAKQVERAYLLALCRPPTRSERDALVEFLRNETESLSNEAGPRQDRGSAAAREQALQQACRVLFNLNEFAYTD
ncbi:MAG TPA: DUF1549 and DUF1553 domain-containing protein [Gemmataceae bacterium]|nr:DUF1549 and DUF1553 domain-containing protein [Gemmataceae bacterium]